MIGGESVDMNGEWVMLRKIVHGHLNVYFQKASGLVQYLYTSISLN